MWGMYIQERLEDPRACCSSCGNGWGTTARGMVPMSYQGAQNTSSNVSCLYPQYNNETWTTQSSANFRPGCLDLNPLGFQLGEQCRNSLLALASLNPKRHDQTSCWALGSHQTLNAHHMGKAYNAACAAAAHVYFEALAACHVSCNFWSQAAARHHQSSTLSALRCHHQSCKCMHTLHPFDSFIRPKLACK